MKIFYITDWLIPSYSAHSIQVMKMCQAMAQKGHDVTLIIPNKGVHPPDVHSASFWHHYGILQRFPIQPIRYHDIGRFSDYLFGWKTVRYARRAKADLIYTRFPGAALFAGFMGLPTICELHEIPQYQRFDDIYRPLLKRAPRLLHFVVITEALKSDLLKQYPDLFKKTKIIVAPDGVDLERFQQLPDRKTARKLLDLNITNDFVAGYTGHFYLGKGVELIYQLANRCPRVTFLLMGGTPETIETHRQSVRQKGLENVILIGFVDNADLPIYLSSCDVLLLPNQPTSANQEYSYISRWTSPLKLFEYLACKRPIIASDLPVLREILNDGNALICPPENLDRWQNALLTCRKNTALCKALAVQSRQDVFRHTWKNRVMYCLNGFNNK